MTRFARAKGSKASNEKLPEQATSWSEMKQEMLNKNKEIAEEKGRQEALKKRQANYQAFLQEKEEEEDKNVAWADFPEANKSNKKRKVSESINSSNKKLKSEDSEDSDGQFSALKSQIDKVLEKHNDNAEQFQQIVDSDDSDAAPEEISIKQKPQEIIVKKAKNTKQKLKIVVDKEKALEPATEKILTEKEQKLVAKKQERYKRQVEKKKLRKQQKQNENPALEVPKKPAETKEEIEAAKLERKLARRERQKEKRRLGRLQKAEENKPKLGEEDLKKINKKKEKKVKQIEKRQKFKEALKTEENNKELNQSKNLNDNNNFNSNKKFNERKNFNDNNNFNSNKNSNERNNFNDNNTFNSSKNFNENKKFEQQERKPPTKKPPKPRDNNRDHQNRKQKPEIMYINGKTVDVDYVDGFPVKKEDADRLKQLRKEMISKGLPRSEINVALKLERRRAEKAFTREKKNVCFNCRKSGHNLSECPELGKDQGLAQTAGTGICFKCGSTEHTHFQCKVVKGMDYKFATCFICKEPGHISRQCPDNQRGLYPKGGSCKVCGDVTHLKKDCPKYQAQQSQLQSSLSIGIMDNGNPDDFEGIKGATSNAGFVNRPNKVVKF